MLHTEILDWIKKFYVFSFLQAPQHRREWYKNHIKFVLKSSTKRQQEATAEAKEHSSVEMECEVIAFTHREKLLSTQMEKIPIK